MASILARKSCDQVIQRLMTKPVYLTFWNKGIWIVPKKKYLSTRWDTKCE